MPLRVTERELPALHGSASEASLEGQSTYLRLIKLDLAALVIGGGLTAVSASDPATLKWLAVAGALSLAAGLILTVVISAKNYEQRWYGGRAAAESVKTLAWRYMMGADPFPRDLEPKEADTRFVSQLRDILDQNDQLSVQLGGLGGRSQISEVMRNVRDQPLESRKSIYLRDRVQEQRDWYGKRANTNSGSEGNSFFLIILLQFFAMGFAILLVAKPVQSVNWSAVLATAATAAIAWLQVKRHQELAQSYRVAEHELGLIEEDAYHIGTDEDLAAFVSDAEAAISREHTLWVARRDVPGVRRRLR